MSRCFGALTVSIAALTIGACGMQASQSAGEGSTEAATAKEIAERVTGYLAAIENNDVDAAADYWTSDARLRGPGIDLDRSAVLDGMRSAFAAGTRVDVLARPSRELFVHGNVAYELAQAEEVFVSGSRADTMRNNMFIRWERNEDGVWRFDRVLLSPQALNAQ